MSIIATHFIISSFLCVIYIIDCLLNYFLFYHKFTSIIGLIAIVNIIIIEVYPLPTKMSLFLIVIFYILESQQSEGNERLQTLISKYRSHSQLPATPEKKPISHTLTAGRLAMGAKSRTFGLTVPKTPDGKVHSSDNDTGLRSPRSGHKGPPPPPPPKPKVKFNSSTGALSRLKDMTDSPSAKTSQDQAQALATDSLMDSQEQRDINALIQK